jgi:large exoprotein involved in heme utilization and adhesion
MEDFIDPNFYSGFAGPSTTDPAGNMSSRGTSASGSASGISGTSWATREGTLLQGGGVELLPTYSNPTTTNHTTYAPRSIRQQLHRPTLQQATRPGPEPEKRRAHWVGCRTANGSNCTLSLSRKEKIHTFSFRLNMPRQK